MEKTDFKKRLERVYVGSCRSGENHECLTICKAKPFQLLALPVQGWWQLYLPCTTCFLGVLEGTLQWHGCHTSLWSSKMCRASPCYASHLGTWGTCREMPPHWHVQTLEAATSAAILNTALLYEKKNHEKPIKRFLSSCPSIWLISVSMTTDIKYTRT